MSSAQKPLTTAAHAPTVVLSRAPGCLGLPSADPAALAVEAMLRMVHTKYVKKDARYRDLAITVPASSAEDAGSLARGPTPTPGAPVTIRGVEAIIANISSALDAEVIANDQRPAAVCVEALATKCLFPAFVFATLYDYNLYEGAIRKSVTPKIGTLWESLRGTFRQHMLTENPYFHSDANAGGAAPPSRISPSLAQAGVLAAVLEEVARALRSLELLHVAHAAAGESFFLGTARPCSVDAYAYAAVSAFLHADFMSPSPAAAGATEERPPLSLPLVTFQERARRECPLLLRYVERVRPLIFADYSGTYNLKPVSVTWAMESASAGQAVEDMYARGRLKTLLWTGAFACFYFIVANADLLVAVAEELAEMHGDEAEAEGASENAEAAEDQAKK